MMIKGDSMQRVSCLLLILLGLTACADESAVRLGPQQWQDTQFVVESRPSPIRVGMNEFIVIATRERGRPGVGLVVSLRVNNEGDWHQAIQDGFTGVYRRAVKIDNPQTDVLSVQVRRSRPKQGEDSETTLNFPLGK